MSFVITRPLRLLVSIAAAGALLVGCGSGPSQVGAAAIVGDTAIPVTDVQSWFDAVLRKEPGLREQLHEQGQMDELARQLAAHSVQHELLRQAARDEGLNVDERKVTDLVNSTGGPQAATAGKIYTPDNFRDAARDQLLAIELGRKYLDRLGVTFDFTQATTRGEAEAKARQMAQGPQAATGLIESDRKAGVAAGADERLHASESVQLAGATPLFGAAPGTVVAFEPKPQSGQWLIALIKDRNTQAHTSVPAAAKTDDQTLQAVGMRLLGVTADRAGVRLSPRYGAWDQVGLAAAPNENETTGIWLTAHDKS